MFAGPLATWLILQLGAIALAAFRVPLAAQYPQPGELQSVRVMLAAQFAGVALLFPWLLRNRAMVLTTLAAAWLMLMAAAALAAWPLWAIAPTGAFLTFWIVLLATVRQAVPARFQMFASATASLYIAGGALLGYLNREFGTTSTIGSPPIALGPLITAISTPRHLPPLGWVQAAALELIAVSLLFVTSKPRNSTPLAPPADSGLRAGH